MKMKRSRKVAGLALLNASLALSTATAQDPPDIGRWNVPTAIAPTQGLAQGDPLQLTWGFFQDGANVPGFGLGAAAPNNILSFLDGIYPGGSAEYLPLFESTFDRWSSISGLSYQFEANDDGAAFATTPGILGTRADVRIGGRTIDGPGGTLAFNFFPNSGDMVIDTGDPFFNDTGGNSLGLRNVLAHEHGHGIGMPHVDVGTPPTLLEPFVNLSFDGPQFHDILLAQRGYGDALERSNNGLGNDTTGLATVFGMIDDSMVVIGEDARRMADLSDFEVAPTQNDFISIDDETDTDVYSFSLGALSDVEIDLEALGVAYQTGPSGGGTSLFDTTSRSDLALEVLDANGAVLFSSDITGLGGTESLDLRLVGGSYFVRVTGADNGDGNQIDTQFYSLGLSAATAVPEPATATLFAVAGMAGLLRRRRR